MHPITINALYLGLGIWLAALMAQHIQHQPHRRADLLFIILSVGLQLVTPMEIKTAFWLWLGMTGGLALFGFEYLVRWSERQEKSTLDRPDGF